MLGLFRLFSGCVARARPEDPAYKSIELAAAQRERCREEGRWLEVGNGFFCRNGWDPRYVRAWEFNLSVLALTLFYFVVIDLVASSRPVP